MIPESELMLTSEGKIYHLNLSPEQIATNIILVGDPGRVATVAQYFSEIEFQETNREFVTVTGYYKNERISVISTGIGVGNIDIVLNELDALVNIDFKTRKVKHEKVALNLIRIGTTGSLQDEIQVGSFIISQKVIGLDGMLNFLEGRNAVSDKPLERALHDYIPELDFVMRTYAVDASEILLSKLSSSKTFSGITLTAPGFYASQGRVLRLPYVLKGFNDKIESFSFDDLKITNYEMETSLLYGYSKLLGHEACTICLAIANRPQKKALNDYHQLMKLLIEYTLECILSF